MPVIHMDESIISALREVMEQDFALLLDTFLSDSSARLAQLQRATDADGLSQAAHSLKGSSSNMGAPQLAELCRQMEQDPHRPGQPETQALLAAIAAEMAIVQQLYAAERQRYPY